jgi:hypothetical protein
MAGRTALVEGTNGERVVVFRSNVDPSTVFLAVNGPTEDDGPASARVTAADAITLGVALIHAAGSEVDYWEVDAR